MEVAQCILWLRQEYFIHRPAFEKRTIQIYLAVVLDQTLGVPVGNLLVLDDQTLIFCIFLELLCGMAVVSMGDVDT